jgi:hypothetical protein
VTGVDYRKLFANVESDGAVPYASSEVLDERHGVFQGMYLDLAEIQAKIAKCQPKPSLVTVYADVLNVPASTSWSATEPALFLVVRRMQVDGELQVGLDYDVRHAGTFVLFCETILGAVRIAAAYPGRTDTSFTIATAPSGGGVQIAFGEEGPVETARTWAQGMAVALSETFEQALFTEFIFAALLIDREPAISLEQLSWIKSWAAERPEFLSLFYRSGALLALLSSQLNAKANRAAFVPYLNRSVYSDIAAAFVAEASKYEEDYRALSTQKVVDDDFIAQAKVLLANQVSQGEYVERLLAQAKSNYDNAAAAVDAATAKFRAAQREAKLAELWFKEKGVPSWREKKIIEGVIQLGGAIISFGVGIAGVLEGGGAAEAGAAEAAVKTAEEVKEAAKAGSALARSAEQLQKTLEELKRMVEMLASVYAFAQGIAGVAAEIGNARATAAELKEMDLNPGDSALTATYEWEAYRNAADQAIAVPVEEGVEYAAELKLAVDNVAIYGQAVAAAQLAAITASQNYAAVAFQLEFAREEQKALEGYVGDLQQGEEPIIAMMQRFYRRYVDAKSSLLAAVEDYRASFYYWALEQSKTRVSLISPVADLDAGLSSLTAMKLDEAHALEWFANQPQEVTKLTHVIEDAGVLAALREKGTATWSIGLDAFEGLDRLRLDCVRVWIEGAKPKTPKPVTITMKTSGTYLDRYGAARFQFMSKPLERIFAYEVATRARESAWDFEDGSFGVVEVDGRVDREVEYAYFRPTPFAAWTISLQKHNEGIDLSEVSRITMVFAGSAIGDMSEGF